MKKFNSIPAKTSTLLSQITCSDQKNRILSIYRKNYLARELYSVSTRNGFFNPDSSLDENAFYMQVFYL